MNKNLALRIVLQIALLVAISLLSGYSVPDLNDSDWQTVLFLTPYGIIRNLISPSMITTFYSEPSPGQVMLGTGTALGLGALYLAAGVNALLALIDLREKA